MTNTGDDVSSANQTENFLSPKDFAAFSGLSLTTVRRYLAAGKIACIQLGGHRHRQLISVDALSQIETVSGTPQVSKQHSQIQQTPSVPVADAAQRSGPLPRWRKNNRT